MNTTMAVVLPEWLVWMIVFLLLLDTVNKCLDLYRRYLDRKIRKQSEEIERLRGS